MFLLKDCNTIQSCEIWQLTQQLSTRTVCYYFLVFSLPDELLCNQQGRWWAKMLSIIQYCRGVVVVVSEEEALRGDDNEQQEWEHNDVKKY
jgi:hypothetical protein